MQNKLLTRITSGILTASMLLSLFTGVAPAQAAVRAVDNRLTQSADKGKQVFSKGNPNEKAEIAMPLILDKTQIGFTDGYLEQEVIATMTDIQYLGVLTLDEYASFFPVGLDLDRALYLTRDQRNYIKSLDETTRRSFRAAAEAKLTIKDQFVWTAEYDGKDYSKDLSLVPNSWRFLEATEANAPMLRCAAKITWVGEKPVNYAQPETTNDDMAALLDGDTIPETAGTKDISQESPEVQEFLRELYGNGLDQANSDYDLSYFDQNPADPAATTGDDGGFNLMGSPTEPVAEPTPTPPAPTEEADIGADSAAPAVPGAEAVPTAPPAETEIPDEMPPTAAEPVIPQRPTLPESAPRGTAYRRCFLY